MKLLLDTHIFLWWILDDPQLTISQRDLLADPSNLLLWSAASSWELGIKYELGHLPLPQEPEQFIPRHLALNGVQSLSVTDRDAFRAGALPRHHRDPFDRMLVAQAQVSQLTLVSNDPKLRAYDVLIHF